MKKVIKIIGIIVAVMIIIKIGAVGFEYVSDKVKVNKTNNERRNAKTLMEYVKYHDYEHLICDYNGTEDCYSMYFTTDNFKCDALDSHEIIRINNNNTMILDDYSIYDISIGNLYSNNQNCKIREIDVDIKEIKDNYIIATNNKIYELYSESLYEMQNNLKKQLLLEDDILNVFYTEAKVVTSGPSEKENSTAMVLKSDGVYRQYYTRSYDNKKFEWPSKYKFNKEELIISTEEFGNIQYIEIDKSVSLIDGGYYEFDDYKVGTVISDKGFYYLKEIKTDECINYIDVTCEVELKQSEIVKKFMKDIKYIGKNITVLSDNSIIPTNQLTYPLDKDLK